MTTIALRPTFIGRLFSVSSVDPQKSRDRALYRQTVKELSALSDRELRDIGINRCEIPSVASSAC